MSQAQQVALAPPWPCFHPQGWPRSSGPSAHSPVTSGPAFVPQGSLNSRPSCSFLRNASSVCPEKDQAQLGEAGRCPLSFLWSVALSRQSVQAGAGTSIPAPARQRPWPIPN